MPLTDIILTAASVCGGLVTISGLIALILKKPIQYIKQQGHQAVESEITQHLNEERVVIDEVLKEINDKLTEVQDAILLDQKSTRAALRHCITTIYQTYFPTKELPVNIKKNLCSLYEAYKKLNGNSYICEIYEEMMEWKVI